VGRRSATDREPEGRDPRAKLEPLRMSKTPPVARPSSGGRTSPVTASRSATRGKDDLDPRHEAGAKVVEREGIEPLGFAPTTLRAVCRTSGARSSGEGSFVEPSPIEKPI